MSCLGVHFSLSSDEVQQLRAIEDMAERVVYLQETIEQEYFAKHPQRLAQSDKAWDAMHRTLSDGQLSWERGDYPLNYVVLGGELLYTETDYIMVLKTPQQVREVAIALPSITKDEFRRRYFAIDSSSYSQPLDEEDFEYTWDNFLDVRKFWELAAAEGRFVLFTADQ